jgi:predicted type IV restriction endonuclease
LAKIPKKVAERLAKQVRAFQRILADAHSRDINESDTVTIVTDMMARVFGFDKYSEITSEQAIRGTYCDLAVKFEDTVQYLVEVKAIGLQLKDAHLRQAVNYGANHGIPWVVLTNGMAWDVYRIRFDQPISHELVCSIDFQAINPRSKADQGRLFILCREGLTKAAIEEFHEHVKNVNRFVVGALVQSDPVLAVIRRELRRLAPGAKVSTDEIAALLPDVLKRDVVEGKSAEAALKRVGKAAAAKKRRPRKPQAAPEAIAATDA